MSSLSSMLPAPKQKTKAPVKIKLDPLAPGTTEKTKNDDEDDAGQPAKKKLKLGGGGCGLSSMLPAPKNVIAAPSTVSTSEVFVPSSVAKGKAKAFVPPVEQRDEEEPDDQDDQDDEDEEDEEDDDDSGNAGLDFFGLGTTSPGPTASRATTATKNKLSVSSAPTIARPPSPKPQPAATTTPTTDDPHPGWRQMPSGDWVPTTQEAYEQMIAMQSQAPEGFSSADIGRAGGFVAEIDDAARKAEIARERQRKLLRDGVAKASASKAPPTMKRKGEITRLARERHQLTSLIDDAARNHDLLEEKLAIARANKAKAGLKYGF